MTHIPSLAPREHFPALERYVYLNTAANAILPEPVRQGREAYQRKAEEAGTVFMNEEEVYQGTRNRAAELFKTEARNISLIHNTTEGLGQILWGIKPERGTKMVSIDLDFPSVRYSLLRVAEETGADVEFLPVRENPQGFSWSDLENAVDERTSVLCVSHVQYATGHRLPLKELVDLAHRYGALCIVDATQSAGLVPIDVEATGVDALITSSFKWLCANSGVAILYTHPSLREQIVPPLAGWRSAADQKNLGALDLTYAHDGRKFEYGTMYAPVAYGLGQAIDYILSLGMEAICAHSLALGSMLQEGLYSLGARVLTPTAEEQRAGICTATFPGHEGERIVQALGQRSVIASPRLGAVRFSLHLYNNSDDVERTIKELKNLVHT